MTSTNAGRFFLLGGVVYFAATFGAEFARGDYVCAAVAVIGGAIYAGVLGGFLYRSGE